MSLVVKALGPLALVEDLGRNRGQIDGTPEDGGPVT